MIVAIDGPSASGKSTIGRLVARHLALPLVDTGLMYRAVTVLAVEAGVSPEDDRALAGLAQDTLIEVNTSADENPAWLVRANGEDLGSRVFRAALAPVLSRVSQVEGVRHEMVRLQRRYAEGRGVVMVGRDIGTVVFPDADLKLYIDASAAERTRRRADQIRRGEREPLDADAADVEVEVTDRDVADRGRTHSPLRPAEDARRIDTDGRSVSEVFAEILSLIPGPSPGPA
ncbi:MAG TPA: (d)CMP kinase [Candidatus Dormibacteraeota bacterium]|nr:(d)CMP kinase [Candidatus Dormibacteraeota bacterium]